MIFQAFLFAQPYQPVNIVVEDHPEDQHEVAIAIDPVDPLHLMTTWNDFRTAGNVGFHPGYGFSSGDPFSWSTSILQNIDDIWDGGFDPSCTIDRYGNAYYCFIASNGNLGPVYVARTVDNGQNWDDNNQVSSGTLEDKPYMTVDNTGGNYDGRLYVCWTSFTGGNKILFRYSTDMGNNWSSPDTISQSLEDPGEGAYLSPNISNSEISSEVVQAAVPAVAPNGDVYVVWLYTAGSTGSPGEIRVRRSTDGGNTFGPTITAANITTAWKVFVGTGLRATSMPTVTIDPNSGNIYVAYIQYDSGDLNIYYVRSTDQGNSWDPPEIATESTANHQFFPWLTVSPFGTVSIVYYQGISTSVDVYIAESYDNGETFYVPNTKVTEVSSNPNNLANPGFTSDYIGIASTTGHNVYPAWADFRNNNADVYTALYNSAVKLAHEDKSFDNNATYSNSARHLAKSAGYLHEVFASGGEIFYRRSANTGLSWDVTERITTGNGDNLNACLTYTEDANYDPPTIIHAVWERNSGPNTYEVWYARSNAEVINWSEPVRLAILETSQWQSGAMPVITHGGDSDELMIVYASQEGLYYTHSADFGESWSTAQLIFSSPYVRYPTLSGSAEVVSLLYDLEDDKEGVFSRKYDGGSWSSPAWPADIAGTLNNRTPSVTFDAQGRPLAVWKGQIYEDELDPYSSIIFRQGLPDNTWDDWFVVFEHEPEESSLAPSVSYFDKNVDYGVEIVYHTSQDQVKNVVYNGSYWSMPDVNRPGRWANISEEAAGTGNPVFYWTTPDGPPFDIQLEGGTGESTQLARGTGGRENLTLTPRRRAVL